MGARVGTVAGIALSSLALSGCAPQLDLDNGSYVYTRAATEFSDASRALVQGGVVTDVWVTEAARAARDYGYTPMTPANRWDDDSVSITIDGSTVTHCWFVGEEAEHCTVYEDVEALRAGEAARLARWDGLDDGTYRFDGRSVWWELGSQAQVKLNDGVATIESGDSDLYAGLPRAEWLTAHGRWVRYWIDGASEPFALCYDDPGSNDEEICWTWTRLDG